MDKDDYIDISNLSTTTTITNIDTSVGDICISTNDMSVYSYDIDSQWLSLSDTIDLDNITITLDDSIEFEDCMPDIAKVEDMCNDYPALRNAYENFKTIYAMVHQDWQGRQDAENEPPF